MDTHIINLSLDEGFPEIDSDITVRADQVRPGDKVSSLRPGFALTGKGCKVVAVGTTAVGDRVTIDLKSGARLILPAGYRLVVLGRP